MDLHIKIISATLVLAGTQLCAMDKDPLPRSAAGLSQREAIIFMAYKQSFVNKQPTEQDKCLKEFNHYLHDIQRKQNLKELKGAHDEYLFLNPEYTEMPESPFAQAIVKARSQDILDNIQFAWNELRTRYKDANSLYDFEIAKKGIDGTKDNQTPLFNIMTLLALQNWLGEVEPVVEDVQQMTKLLVDNGANTNFQNEFKQTALFKAAMHINGHRMIPLLVRGNAKVDHQDFMGRTPLIWAAYYLNLESLRELIQYGADKTLCDKKGRRDKGRSALEAAQDILEKQGIHRSNKADEIIQLLQS